MITAISGVGYSMPMQKSNVQFKAAPIEEMAKRVAPKIIEKAPILLASVPAALLLASRNINIERTTPKAPLDKTNPEAVLQAKPQELYNPIEADNIKGKGISFLPVVPEDPEALKGVTYDVVPLKNDAATVQEFIEDAKSKGVNIELAQDKNGEYFLGVRNVWSNEFFRIDRDSAVVKYGPQPVDWTSVDAEYVEKYGFQVVEKDKDGNEVLTTKVMDSAVVANSPDCRILSKSYVHEGGAPITEADMKDGKIFRAHKDQTATINAVAWDEVKDVRTLEGPIQTDVTMGDVEGFAYNDFKQLVKQIQKNKIKANPADVNSAKFVDLVKADKLDEAKALLIEITKKSA